jgi:hypothetical protein
MEYIEHSETITGYRVKLMCRAAFRVTGYTLIVPPHEDERVAQFWRDVTADGRLEQLRNASTVRPWLLGLGSWDAECERYGQRYTICIEQTACTDFTSLARAHRLFTKEIGASEWLCFEMTRAKYDERFWQDNPYRMMKRLGYKFYARGDSVGLHFDAYPPDYGAVTTW